MKMTTPNNNGYAMVSVKYESTMQGSITVSHFHLSTSKLASIAFGLGLIARRVRHRHSTEVVPSECFEAIFHVGVATMQGMLELLGLGVKRKRQKL